jgi:hypothetical protein
MLYLILHRLNIGFGLLGTTLIATIILYFSWYKTLPPPATQALKDEEAESFDADFSSKTVRESI